MANGVVPALVAAMAEAGARPEAMRVQIGPSVCGGCYEVPHELQARVAGLVPQSRCVTRTGAPGLNIAEGIRAQLAAAGVSSVSSDPRCTKESAELFSHRRDGTTGRFAGLIWLAS
jgi:polyphenol oxidase